MAGNLLPVDTPATLATDAKIVASMRLILASSGLLIIYIDPAEPDRFVGATYSLLSLYVVYSVALYLIALRQSLLTEHIQRWAHWADVCWYTGLIALSSGTNSLFFFGFIFAILVASFRWGFRSGLLVSVTSAIAFAVISLAVSPQGVALELNRFLIRPIYLLVLGYIIAYRGEFEIGLKRRLTLLKEITRLSNPRFGVDRTISQVLEQLRAFYEADSCLLITQDQFTQDYGMRLVTKDNPDLGMHVEMIPSSLAKQFFALPQECAVTYCNREGKWWYWQAHLHALNVSNGKLMAKDPQTSESLAAKLDAQAFITVPVMFHNDFRGRLYLTGHQPFTFWDIDLLLQVMDHFAPILDNIRLVDRLASDAAESERQRIARDIHDSVIQPYLGLQIGLTALRQNLELGSGRFVNDLDRLIEMTTLGVGNLRDYITTLKSGGRGEDILVQAVQRFASKFSEVTRIAILVDADSEIWVNDRLAAEAFQMIVEGLSNIRRHTHSLNARIRLARNNSHLLVNIENDGNEEGTFVSFTPRSITERTESLGGKVRVEQNTAGGTVVRIEIPL